MEIVVTWQRHCAAPLVAHAALDERWQYEPVVTRILSAEPSSQHFEAYFVYHSLHIVFQFGRQTYRAIASNERGLLLRNLVESYSDREIVIDGLLPLDSVSVVDGKGKLVDKLTVIPQGPGLPFKVVRWLPNSSEHGLLVWNPPSGQQWFADASIELYGVRPAGVAPDPRLFLGIWRAALLKRLKAPIKLPMVELLLNELSNSRLEEHLPRYWRQLHALLPHCSQTHQWHWAARHALPPWGAAYIQNGRK